MVGRFVGLAAVPLVVAAGLVLTAGCATGRPAATPSDPVVQRATVPDPTPRPGDAGPSHTVADGPPCLPPGVAADFLTWPVRSFRPLVIPRDDHTVTAGAWVLYGKGDLQVAAVWGDDELIAVDPNPLTEAPMWFDHGRIDGERHELKTNTTPCQWRRQGERQV